MNARTLDLTDSLSFKTIHTLNGYSSPILGVDKSTGNPARAKAFNGPDSKTQSRNAKREAPLFSCSKTQSQVSRSKGAFSPLRTAGWLVVAAAMFELLLR